MLPRRIGVIGHPIGHTMSPFLHERLFALMGIPLDYRVLDVASLPDALSELRTLHGFNVTIPHKEAIVPYLAGMEEKAARCGSVNTVRVEDGALFGATTDGEGCREALAAAGVALSGELLLLGNGGAARAILFECLEHGAAVTVACRESALTRAGALLREAEAAFPKARLRLLTYGELEGERGRRYDLLLNATSVGMYPNTGASPVSAQVVGRCRAVFDAVFNPRETVLLRLARAQGVKGVYGLDMLVYQAAAAHGFWYGGHFAQAALKALCRDAAEEMEKRFGKGDGA